VAAQSNCPAGIAHLLSVCAHLPCVPGFLGRGQGTGAITTLGRGGSDLTATVLGVALGLKEVQVWKVCRLSCRGAVVKACLGLPQDGASGASGCLGMRL